jgi:histidine triad (HIT) family protein
VREESKGEIVYQDDSLVAFKDIHPRAPVHLLIVPRKHIATLLDLASVDEPVIGHIFTTGARLAREQGLAASGYRMVVNCGAGAGQSVYHVHFHLLGGRPFSWPPG